MPKAKDFKRENFDISPEQQAEIACLQDLLRSSTRKETILTAVRFTLQLLAELRKGNQLYIQNPDGKQLTRLIMPGMETINLSPWQYLVNIAHPWKKELYVKGRKLPASTVWSGMLTNKLSKEQAAENWDLPIEAIEEIVSYCQSNKKLLRMEAEEEERRFNKLMQQDTSLGFKVAHR